MSTCEKPLILPETELDIFGILLFYSQITIF
jgi:hypothetical protein